VRFPVGRRKARGGKEKRRTVPQALSEQESKSSWQPGYRSPRRPWWSETILVLLGGLLAWFVLAQIGSAIPRRGGGTYADYVLVVPILVISYLIFYVWMRPRR
jgi:hypothetical protein